MPLLKDTTQWRRWGSNPRPLGLETITLPLRPPTHTQNKLDSIGFDLVRTTTACMNTGGVGHVSTERAHFQTGRRPRLICVINDRQAPAKSAYLINIFFIIPQPKQNICCGCSKEPSRWDGSFEHKQQMFMLIGKNFITILRTKTMLS